MLRFAFRYNLVSKWSIVAVLIFQCVLTSDVTIHVVIRKKQEIVSYTVVLAVTRKTEIACTVNRCGHMSISNVDNTDQYEFRLDVH